MKKPLTKTIKYGYGIANFGFTLANNVELLFFTFFCTNIAKFSLGTVALIGSISAIANIILTPFYGAVIVKSKPMRWGRLRSWMVIMPPLAGIFFALEFSRLSSSQLISAIIVIIGTVMFDQVYSLAVIAHDSLVNHIANNAEERTMISTRRGLYMSIANIFNSYLGKPLAGVFAVWVGATYSYTLLAFTLCVFMTLTYWFEVRMTRGYELTGDIADNEPVEIEEEKITFREMFTVAIKNTNILAIILADCLRYLSYNILVASVVYYFTYIAQNEVLQIYYLFFGGIIQLIGSYLSAGITKRFSSRAVVIVAMLLVGFLEILCKYLGFNIPVAFAVLMIYRLCHGCAISLIPALIADCAEYEKWKNNAPIPFTIGIINVAPKIAALLRSWIIPAVLAIVGFNANVAPAAASASFKVGVLNMFMLIPGCLSIISGLILFFFYKLTNEKLDEMNKDQSTA